MAIVSANDSILYSVGGFNADKSIVKAIVTYSKDNSGSSSNDSSITVIIIVTVIVAFLFGIGVYFYVSKKRNKNQDQYQNMINDGTEEKDDTN